MNILLTSNKGFLGLSLINLFEKHNEYKLFFEDKSNLNVLSNNLLKKYVKEKKIDVIIHNAIKGGRRITEDDCKTFYENVLMFENIVSLTNDVKLIFNLDSAASFDRKKNIYNFKETLLGKSVPCDFYGLSKMVSALRCQQFSNVINLRIFNCFGELETPERMIKNNITNYVNKKPLIIHQNKYMDFFYIEDLFQVLLFLLKSRIEFKDINLCYNYKTTLIDIANHINDLENHKSPIIIEKEGLDLGYCGDSSLLASLDIKLIGLTNGILKMHKRIKESIYVS